MRPVYERLRRDGGRMNKKEIEKSIKKLKIDKKKIEKCIEELRLWAVKWTGCSIQHNGWPCGTCFCDLIARLGVKETGIHNKPVDRVNEFWRAILQIRGDYEKEGV